MITKEGIITTIPSTSPTVNAVNKKYGIEFDSLKSYVTNYYLSLLHVNYWNTFIANQ